MFKDNREIERIQFYLSCTETSECLCRYRIIIISKPLFNTDVHIDNKKFKKLCYLAGIKANVTIVFFFFLLMCAVGYYKLQHKSILS